MSELWTSPFNLVEGNLIVAVVEARNEVGYAIPSDYNTVGALVQVIPHDPTLIPVRETDTNENDLHFTIPTHTQTGGSPLTSY
jgi:hypothetical protein